MYPIAWDDAPGPSSVPVPIHNTPRRCFLRALGDPVGVFVHWAFGRTVPCLGAGCAHCQGGQPSRWAGYVPALLYAPQSDTTRPRWKPVIWYVSEADRPDLGGGPIRGTVYEAVRAEGKPGRRPLVSTVKERPTAEPAEAAFDVREHLARMWRHAEPSAPAAAPTADVKGDEPDLLPFRLDGIARPSPAPAGGRRPRPRRKGGAS